MSAFIRLLQSGAAFFGAADHRSFHGTAATGRPTSICLRGVFLGVLAWMAISAPAIAQTQISGTIAADARWTQEGGPYIVSGDVALSGGATLTVEAGTTVFMAPGSSLTVQGALKVMGTAEHPVRVQSDKVRAQQTPGKGDWGQLTITAGSQGSELNYAVIEHGRGMQVLGTSVVLNHVALRANDGPAITTDLKASLSGAGNEASDNQLNGVLVPGGDIASNVSWRLRGIPYVVAGTVSVGESPSGASASPVSVQRGRSATVTVTGKRLAGLTRASVDEPGIEITALPGGSSTQFSLTVAPSQSAPVGTLALNASVAAGQIRVTDAFRVLPAQPEITSLSPSVLYTGQGNAGVLITGYNLDPASKVRVNGVDVPSTLLSETQIKATVANQTAAVTLNVQLRTPDPSAPGQYFESSVLNLPVQVARLEFSPSTVSVGKGLVKNVSVSVPYAAPQGGLTISLAASLSTVLGVPANVTIPAGSNSASFEVQGREIGSSFLTATHPNFANAQTGVSVVAPPTLGIKPDALALEPGRSAQVQILSNVPAAAGGLNVALSSDAPTVARVPSTVTIPAGATSTVVSVDALALGSARIEARSDGFVAGQANVVVRLGTLALPADALIAPGRSRSLTVSLSGAAPAGGLVVSLTSSDAAVATVPSSVTVAQGETSASFTIEGVAAGQAQITASATSYQSASLAARVSDEKVSLYPLTSSLSIMQDETPSFSAALRVLAPAGGLVVHVRSLDPTVVTVSPATIVIPEGAGRSIAEFAITAIAKGTTSIELVADGLNAVTIPVTVKSKPRFVFGTGGQTVGKGLKRAFELKRVLDDVAYRPYEAVTVQLSSSDASRLGVPSSVTIPAGTDYVWFDVIGVDLASETPVTVSATAPGYASSIVPLAIRVMPTKFEFADLASTIGAGGARNRIRLRLLDSADLSASEFPAIDTLIDLAIVDANPSGIVGGLFSTAEGGASITQTLFRANSYWSEPAFVGTATVEGSYRIRASASAIGAGVSPAVTVANAALSFSQPRTVVGKGLRTHYSELSVLRTAGGQPERGASELRVALEVTDASRVRAPTEVVIWQGREDTYLPLVGLELTNGSPALVRASAPGYAPATLEVDVVAPVIRFSNLETERVAGDGADEFNLVVKTPGSQLQGENQEPDGEIPIHIEVVDANPPEVAAGLFEDGASSTDLLLTVNSYEWMYGNRGSRSGYLGAPRVPGSFRLKASSDVLGVSTLSDVITFAPPTLKFSESSLKLGKGFHTAEFRVDRSGSTADEQVVALISSDPSKVSVPASVTIPSWSNSAYFAVEGVDVTSGEPVTIRASSGGLVDAVATVEVVAPSLTINYLDAGRSLLSDADDFRVCLGAAGSETVQAPSAELAVALSVVDSSPAGVVDGIYKAYTSELLSTATIGAGWPQNCSQMLAVGAPRSLGSYKVRVSVPGWETVQSEPVTVGEPALAFESQRLTAGKGLITQGWIGWRVNGVTVRGPASTHVQVSCANAAVCRAEVDELGEWGGGVRIEGLSLGATVVEVRTDGSQLVASAPVSVVAPQLWLAKGDWRLAVGVTADGVSQDAPAQPLEVRFATSDPLLCPLGNFLAATIDAGTSWLDLNYDLGYGCTLFADAPGFQRASVTRGE